MPNDPTTPPKRRRGRKWLAAILSLVVVLIALVALAPTLVSMGLGRGSILAAINKQLNGSAAIGTLSLGWFSPQRVDGLVITDAKGKEAVNVNVHVNTGLLNLLMGKADPLAVSLDGVLSGEIRGDGSTSFAELAAKSPPGAGGPPSAGGSKSGGGSAAGAGAAALPAVTLNIPKLTLNLYDAVRQQTLTFKDLSGTVAISSQRDITATLAGTTSAGDLAGSINLSADVKGLMRIATGAPGPGPSADVQLDVQHMPVMLTDRGEIIDSLKLSITGADLTREAHIVAAADITIPGAQPGRLDADLTVAQPLAADGSLAIGVEKIQGQLIAKNIPTALLQPTLAGTAVIAERDIGRTVDATVQFGAGGGPGGTRKVVLDLKGEHLQLTGAADVDLNADSLRGSDLHLVTTVQPALLAAYAKMNAEAPLALDAKLDTFTLPALKKFNKAAMQRIAAVGSIGLTGAATIQLPGENPQTLAFNGLNAQFDSPALAERIHVKGTAAAEQAAVQFEQNITGLFAADGSLATTSMIPTGFMKIDGVQPALVKRFAPEQAEIIDAALTGPLNVMIETSSPQPPRIDAQVRVASQTLDADIALSRGSSALTVGPGKANVALSPQLVAVLQKDQAKPIALSQPARVTLALEAMEIPATASGGYDFNAGRIAAAVTLDDAVLANVPGLAEPVGVHDLRLGVVTKVDPKSPVTASFDGEIQRQPTRHVVAKINGAAGLDRSGGALQRLTADVAGLAVVELEGLLGRPPQSLSEWLGPSGSLSAVVQPSKGGGYEAAINSKLAQLTGVLTAAMSNDMLTLSADHPQLTLRQASLQRMLSSGAVAPAAGQQPAAVTVQGDMTLTPTIRTCRVPLGLLSGKAFDPAAVNVDLGLTGTPLRLQHNGGLQTSLSELSAALRSNDLRKGIDFTLNAKAENSSAPGTPSPVEVKGRLTQLLGADGTLALAKSNLELTANATGVATAIADALGQMNGLLVDAIGAQMNATATAVDFSGRSGKLDANLQATNGWLKGKAEGRDNSLWVRAEAPITAELQITPPLRERLLYKIHPVLADIRTTKQPMRATISAESVPLDGNVSRLNADIEITIGEVEIDGGSSMLFVLALFNQAKGKNISGYIEPIRAKIRNGVVTYDRFVVKIDKYQMAYSGQVDLNTQKVELRTEVPADALAKTFHELEGLVEGTFVPIRTFGVFGNLKTEADFGGLIQQAIPKALEKGLEDLFKKRPK